MYDHIVKESMLFECPGSQNVKQPKPEIMACPSCGAEVELWTDEVLGPCPACGTAVLREEGLSCLDWCRYAKKCEGVQAYNKYVSNRSVTIQKRLTRELEEYFGGDKKRIHHALRVMGYAEKLLEYERGNWHIVIPAGILHDIGIKEAERKYGSSAGHYQEKEGPPVARTILIKTGFKKEDIDEICGIIAHHHTPGKITTKNFKILYDADWLVNLEEEVDITDKEKLKGVIEKVFLTETGRKMAQDIYG